MERIEKVRVVPVVTLQRAEDAVPIAEALREGGIPIIEVTFRTDAAEQAVLDIVKAVPDMLVGAGTLLTPQQVYCAAAAGATFGVSPGLNDNVLRTARERALRFVPGVVTATEIERAMGLGCNLLKFFPAEPAGGVRMLKALAGPYAHTGVKFIPLGSVNPDNAADYLALPVVAAVGGSWIAGRDLIEKKDWAAITRNAKDAVSLAASVAR